MIFRKQVLLIVGVLLQLAAANGYGAVQSILRSKSDFGELRVEETANIRVKSARVALADYELIAKDFPALRIRSGEAYGQWVNRIDQWVVVQTAFISVENAKQTTVNTPIAITDERKSAYRPPGYGRAFVIPVACGGRPCGLIDAKGMGVVPGAVPVLVPAKRDGLATLGEVTREYLYEKLVELIFQREGNRFDTVGSYAVVDFGFELKHADGSTSRAGYILRQSHVRSTGHNSSLPVSESLKIEKMLRKYGVTSSGETAMGSVGYRSGRIIEIDKESNAIGAEPFDYINIQGTNNRVRTEVIDFGAYIALKDFTRPLRNPERISEVLLQPGTAEFIQPNEQVRIPLEQWGDFGIHDPKSDKPFIWSHELAEAFARGRADKNAFQMHYNNLLGPVRARWGM